MIGMGEVVGERAIEADGGRELPIDLVVIVQGQTYDIGKINFRDIGLEMIRGRKPEGVV